jgi:omega-6 fatty acid desaturase (delta-12 desaturase)
MTNINSPNKNIILADIFKKYKSSYTSAFIDFSIHTFIMCSLFYSLWYFRNNLFSILIIPLLALMFVRSFVVFHDCCHNSYTPNKTLNYVISHIMGLMMFTGPNWYLDHETHHLVNGNIENKQHYFFNETIILTKKQFLKKNNKLQSLYKLYKNPLVFFTIVPIIYFGIYQRFIYIVKKYRHSCAFKKSLFGIIFDNIINNVLLCLYLYMIYNFGLIWQLIGGFILSCLIGFCLFHNQHSFNPAYVVNNDEWSQQGSGLLGSSFIQIPYLLKYFFMGIEYHHIHHMNAKIPGYNIQAYHEEISSNSDMFVSINELSITECYNNLWLVLYDENKKKYITFAEVDEEIKKEK